MALALVTQPALVFGSHTANCSEYDYVHRWVGYLSDNWVDHRYGVKATFTGVPLELCSSPRPGEGSASVAWVAIQGKDPGCCSIVQIGLGRCYPTTSNTCTSDTRFTNRDFWAYGYDRNSPGCSGMPASLQPSGWWWANSSGGYPYSVTEDTSGNFDLVAHYGSVGLPSSEICWSNDTVAVSTESWDYGDALGHTSALPLNVSQERFKTSASGAWLVLPSLCNLRAKESGGDPGSVFHCAVNGASLDIWTAR